MVKQDNTNSNYEKKGAGRKEEKKKEEETSNEMDFVARKPKVEQKGTHNTTGNFKDFTAISPMTISLLYINIARS